MSRLASPSPPPALFPSLSASSDLRWAAATLVAAKAVAPSAAEGFVSLHGNGTNDRNVYPASTPGQRAGGPVVCKMRCGYSIRACNRQLALPYGCAPAVVAFSCGRRGPMRTAITFFFVCGVLTGIGKFSSVLAQFVTWLGVILLSMFGLWCVVLTGARSLAFPGYLSLVCRSMENEVTKRSAMNHRQDLVSIADMLALTDDDSDFGSKMCTANAVVQRGTLKIMLATLKHMQSVGRLTPAGCAYMVPLEALLDSVDLLAPTLHSAAGQNNSQANTVSKRSRLILLRHIEELREGLSRPLEKMTEQLGATLYHEPKSDEIDASSELIDSDDSRESDDYDSISDDETVNLNNTTDVRVDGIGGEEGDTGAKKNVARRKSTQHWLVSLYKTVAEFLVSWYAARQPLDVVINIAF